MRIMYGQSKRSASDEGSGDGQRERNRMRFLPVGCWAANQVSKTSEVRTKTIYLKRRTLFTSKRLLFVSPWYGENSVRMYIFQSAQPRGNSFPNQETSIASLCFNPLSTTDRLFICLVEPSQRIRT